MTKRAILILLWTATGLMQIPACADGGVLRFRSEAGSWIVTLFTPAELSSATSTELAFLVQQADGGAIVQDAVVELGLEPPAGTSLRNGDVFCGPLEELPPQLRPGGTGTPAVIPATLGRWGNPLLYGARVRLPWPGDWGIRLTVRRGAESHSVSSLLPVGGPAQRLWSVWPSLLLPPMAIVLFAANQSLRRRKARN